MVYEIIKFIFNQIVKVFDLLSSIELWQGMSLLTFQLVIMLIPFIIKIFHLIYSESVDTAESDYKYNRRKKR